MSALKAPTPGRSSTYSPTQDDMGVSPIKCASLRSQYIEQLKQRAKAPREEYEQALF